MGTYWQDVISTNFECKNCGGELKKTGGCPVFKGSLMAYKCIRCSATGTVEDKITWDGIKTSGCVTRT